MSSSHRIPHTITYSGAGGGGADSPLFIAGTFSKPEWLLQEMHPSTPSNGRINYSISINVEPGKEYQYRFRHGREGDWTVDEKKDIVKSALGTRSNILRIKEPVKPSNGNDDSVSYTVPLFAHERLGAYTLSDGYDSVHNDLTSELKREISPRSFGDVPADLNDPTLESFPCDKSSIMGTLRKIQSSHGEQNVEMDGDRTVRRSSVDSDDGSSGSASPGVARRREGRLSGGSNGRNRSHASLGSIAEEPSGNSHKKDRNNIVQTARGDNGEALMMRASKRN